MVSQNGSDYNIIQKCLAFIFFMYFDLSGERLFRTTITKYFVSTKYNKHFFISFSEHLKIYRTDLKYSHRTKLSNLIDSPCQPIFNQSFTSISLENLRKREVFDVFRGYRGKTLVENGLVFVHENRLIPETSRLPETIT